MLFPIFINSFKDLYLTVKRDPCSLTGDYNTDCGADMINRNKCVCPFQFCHTFHLRVPSNFPIYQMLRMYPQNHSGLLSVLSAQGLFSAWLDLCFVFSVHAVLLFFHKCINLSFFEFSLKDLFPAPVWVPLYTASLCWHDKKTLAFTP